MGSLILGSLCFIGGFIAAAFLIAMGQEVKKAAEDQQWPDL